MLTLDHISKTFNPGTINEKRALDGLSLHLKPGDFVTVIGGNGAGKSTMLNAVAGVWPVDSGRIILDGVDVTAMPEYRRAQYIGRVFQDPMMGTAANMQIEENLALAARRGKKRTLRWGVTKAEREEYHEKLKSFGLGLEDRMTAKVGLLSGGQRQALTLLMAEAAAARRAHRGARPRDGGQGARAVGPHRARKPAHRYDDHPQHEGRHRSRQPPHHDERGPHHPRYRG